MRWRLTQRHPTVAAHAASACDSGFRRWLVAVSDRGRLRWRDDIDSMDLLEPTAPPAWRRRSAPPLSAPRAAKAAPRPPPRGRGAPPPPPRGRRDGAALVRTRAPSRRGGRAGRPPGPGRGALNRRRRCRRGRASSGPRRQGERRRPYQMLQVAPSPLVEAHAVERGAVWSSSPPIPWPPDGAARVAVPGGAAVAPASPAAAAAADTVPGAASGVAKSPRPRCRRRGCEGTPVSRSGSRGGRGEGRRTGGRGARRRRPSGDAAGRAWRRKNVSH